MARKKKLSKKEKQLRDVLGKWISSLGVHFTLNNDNLSSTEKAYLLGRIRAFKEIQEILDGEVDILEPVE